MRRIGAALLSIVLVAGAAAPRIPAVLGWAYLKAPPNGLLEARPGRYRVPGSAVVLSAAQVNDDNVPPDWFPAEHPAPPAIVAHGHDGGPTPCAACHLMNGAGYLGIPSLAGLPAGYIVAQVHAFADGSRASTEPGRPNTAFMIAEARAVPAADLAAAAAYFAALPPPRWFSVVQTATAPAARPDHYGWLDVQPHAKPVPLAGRIEELPDDVTRNMLLEDPHSGATAYVPLGAVARGAVLAADGGGGGVACASCHGAGLRGALGIPRLAGRSPTYLARALWDIKSGARHDRGRPPCACRRRGWTAPTFAISPPIWCRCRPDRVICAAPSGSGRRVRRG